MYKQAVIYYKDNHKDWIDPLDENSIVIGSEIITIDNGYHNYIFCKKDVAMIECITVYDEGDGDILYQDPDFDLTKIQ